MALPIKPIWDEVYLTAFAADITTATAATAYVQSPIEGEIMEFGSCIQASIATTDAVITLKKNGTTITGATLTITASGSGAGNTDTGAPTKLTAAARALAQVSAGDSISFVSDFGPDDATVPCQFYVKIANRRTN